MRDETTCVNAERTKAHTWELALGGAGGGPTTEEGSIDWLAHAKGIKASRH